MKVIIETPRWSFVKYRFEDGRFVKESLSPLPSFFNYGFIKGTEAADGMPEDAIVLGKVLPQGAEADVKRLGTVHFIDDGLEDDKAIGGDRISFSDRAGIHLFFTVYMFYKIIHYFLKEGRIAKCRYLGFSLAQD